MSRQAAQDVFHHHQTGFDVLAQPDLVAKRNERRGSVHLFIYVTSTCRQRVLWLLDPGAEVLRRTDPPDRYAVNCSQNRQQQRREYQRCLADPEVLRWPDHQVPRPVTGLWTHVYYTHPGCAAPKRQPGRRDMFF